MFYTSFLIAAISAYVAADTPVSPPVRCGEPPALIYKCIGNPRVIKSPMMKNCGKDLSECERMTCTFTNAGWIKDGKVEKAKMQAYFDQFAVDHPEWAPAVEQTKKGCLTTDLPALGVFQNCPAYDVIYCSFVKFTQYAQPSQWSTEPACAAPRQFAAVCPMCPAECFAPLVPYGTCNACLALPRASTPQ